jgi:GT2 family glycosyltransferase
MKWRRLLAKIARRKRSTGRDYTPRTKVDPEWYRQHYPDITQSGRDPQEHFDEFGRAEGRVPNAKEQVRHEASFDEAWYLRRYPDVAQAGWDALDHYILYGRDEGRAANQGEETKRLRSGGSDSDWYLKRNHEAKKAAGPADEAGKAFDPAWYVARYSDVAASGMDPLDHFLSSGLGEGRAPNAREESQAAWRERFDADWYLRRNPDVERAGLDPLEHYLARGIVERRMPNSRERPEGRAVEDSRIECRKEPSPAREVALFVALATGGRLQPHVPYYVSSLAQHDIAVVLIVAGDEPLVPIDQQLHQSLAGLYIRENSGYDFAAWAHVLRLKPELMNADVLYLINDSVFGPTSKSAFAGMLRNIRSSSQDVIGLTESHQRGWHLQTYFLALKKSALQSAVLRSFFSEVVAYQTEDDVINEYETQLGPLLQSAGLHCAPLFPMPGVGNPARHGWRELLSAGFPFVAAAALRAADEGAARTHWRQLLKAQGYDTALADLALAEVAERAVSPAVRTHADAKLNFRRRSQAALHRFLATGQAIDVPASPAPIVSILIVLYNQAELTMQCLAALESTVDIPAEVIIIDNASSDDTADLLDRVRGARIIRNAENLHFLLGVNQAAAQATGRALLLLNNDACLRPGALQFALETLDSGPDVGAVGGKLILPDGTLQEAGSIVWADGTCAGYGRGRDPDGPEFQFRREVDYCSGACLLLRRDLFERLGGLDRAYAPAYYEETDLCMRIRRAGYRILYDPRIEVSHYEFASSARPEASQLMLRNQTLFRERHNFTLQRLHLPSDSPTLLARASDRWRPRLLMIEDLMPNPAYGAGFPRSLRILSTLRRLGFFVTYFPVDEPLVAKNELFANFPLDVEFALGPDRPSAGDLIEGRAGFYQGLVVCRPANMRRLAARFEASPAPLHGVRIVYDSEAVTAPREAQQQELSGTPLSVAEKRAALEEELRPATLADAVVVVNRPEAALFVQNGHTNVHVVGNSIAPVPTPTPFEERQDFLFVGRLTDDTTPNTDSLFWFIEHVMPHLDRLLGSSYNLYVAGETGSERLRNLTDERVKRLGRIDDLSHLYNRARVFVAPTRFAAGIPLKVQEAASRGVPCVVTELLLRQLDWRTGQDVLAASTPEAFARECARLYQDRHLWETLRNNALARVTTECAPAAFDAALIAALRSVHLHPPSGDQQVQHGWG